LLLLLQVAAGGDPQGTLDFYSVHGYPIWGEPKRDVDINMFTNPKSHWCLDKPVIVGEHWDEVLSTGQHVATSNYVHLHQTGYAGAWGWAWLNVSESFDRETGVGVRSVLQHECRPRLRQLLQSLPESLRYPVHGSNATVVASSGSNDGSSTAGSGARAVTAAAVSIVDGQTIPVSSG
jgi:hypothetical protein